MQEGILLPVWVAQWTMRCCQWLVTSQVSSQHCWLQVRALLPLPVHPPPPIPPPGYLQVGEVKMSRDQSMLAVTIDLTGADSYTLFVRDVVTGQLLTPPRSHVASVEWAADSCHLFYTVTDNLLRSCK